MMKFNRRSFLIAGAAACGCFLPSIGAGAEVPEGLICGLTDMSLGDAELREGDREAMQLMRLITAGVGIQPNFQIWASDTPLPGLAYAQIIEGRRRILYDSTVFQFALGRTHWLAVGAIAHEIGHHLANHIFLDETSRHGQELEADYFAGAAIARLGGTEHHAMTWTRILNEEGAVTHPPRKQRVEAALAGWHSVRR